MKSRLLVIAVSIAFLLMLSGYATCKPGEPEFELTKIEGAEDLREAEKRLLKENGLFIKPETYKQIFEVYNGSPPNFITVDSVIETFRVLLEECLSCQENAAAGELEEQLLQMHKAVEQVVALLPEKPGDESGQLARKGTLFLSGYISTAGKLLHEEFPVNPAVKDAVAAELKLIQCASGTAASPLTNRVRDYSRFKVRGKYSSDPETAAYFRSVFFLSRTAFHVESPHETLAALVLKLSAGEKQLGPALLYRKVFGAPDDLTPEEYGDAIDGVMPEDVCKSWEKKKDVASLVKYVELLQNKLRTLRDPKTNDEWLAIEEFKNWPRITKGLRLVGAAYLPDADLLLKVSEPYFKERQLPSGLDVGIFLGSERAKELLARSESGETMLGVTKAASAVKLSDESLYGRFLGILKSYLKEIESRKDHQQVFRTTAWQDKVLNTVLCGWAQARHGATLAGKDSASYGGCFDAKFVGCAEPVPRFYLGVAELLCDFESLLGERVQIPIKPCARRLLYFVPRMREALQKAESDQDVWQIEDMLKSENPAMYDIVESAFDTWDRSRVKQNIDKLEEAAKRILAGKSEKEDEKRIVSSATTVPQKEYKGLIRLCIQLARIAQKQLDGVEFDEKEKNLIQFYGTVLGALHFYEGNSWLAPRDDMPVAATAFTNHWRRKVLMSGIGRARCMKIAVKDPGTGKLVLCSAGITLYHEHVSSAPLSDEEWRRKLEEKDGPKPAEWLRKYIAAAQKIPGEK